MRLAEIASTNSIWLSLRPSSDAIALPNATSRPSTLRDAGSSRPNSGTSYLTPMTILPRLTMVSMVEPAGKVGLLAVGELELLEPPLGLSSSPPHEIASVPMASTANMKASLNIDSGFMGRPSCTRELSVALTCNYVESMAEDATEETL